MLKKPKAAKAARSARSEKLTAVEHQSLLQWVAGKKNKTVAAKKLKIARNTLHMVSISGSGNPTTIRAIRKQISL